MEEAWCGGEVPSRIAWDFDYSAWELRKLAVYDCASNVTLSVSAAAANQLLEVHAGPQHQDTLQCINLAWSSSHNDDDSDNGYALYIGPVLALIAWLSVLAYLFARRNAASPTSALAEHPDVPLFVRLLIPSMLVGTMGLFAFSNATTGASVQLKLGFFGQHKNLAFTVFEFSLVNTVKEMWLAGAYPLSLLVAVWSGFFPYLKLSLMLVCWLVPPHSLLPAHRRRMLLALDVLGKWALIDLFLMNMMTVAFRFHITTESIALLKNLLVVDVVVLPKVGLFTFVTAVAMSLLANHIIIAYHRNVVSLSEQAIDDGRQGSAFRQSQLGQHSAELTLAFLQETIHSDDDEEDSDAYTTDGAYSTASAADYHQLVDSAKLRPSCQCLQFPKGAWFDVGTREVLDGNPANASARRVSFARLSVIDHAFASLPALLLQPKPNVLGQHKIKHPIRVFIGLFAALSVALILYSGFEDTFQFVFTGLAGSLISAVNPDQAKRRASMLSIARDLGEGKSSDVDFGILYLQSLYLLFAFVLPLLCLAASTYLLFARQSLRGWKLNFFVVETLNAWSSLDVFIVSIIASVLEINQFSHFLAEDLCAPLQRHLGVGECFGVETELLRGCWLVLASSVCFYALTMFVERIAERAIADREEEVAALLVDK